MSNPIAILRNYGKSASKNSVVVITDINVNGTQVIVPVVIGTDAILQGDDTDVHLVLTAYDSKTWKKTYEVPAVENEKRGGVGVFFVNKEKARRYNAFRLLSVAESIDSATPREGIVSAGLVHTVSEAGIQVKMQTETKQFK